MLTMLIIVMTVVMLMLLWMLDSTKQRAEIITQLEKMTRDIAYLSGSKSTGNLLLNLEDESL